MNMCQILIKLVYEYLVFNLKWKLLVLNSHPLTMHTCFCTSSDSQSVPNKIIAFGCRFDTIGILIIIRVKGLRVTLLLFLPFRMSYFIIASYENVCPLHCFCNWSLLSAYFFTANSILRQFNIVFLNNFGNFVKFLLFLLKWYVYILLSFF